jgi:hypothetical protein
VGLAAFTFALENLEHNIVILCGIISVAGLGSAGMPAILEVLHYSVKQADLSQATVETIYPVPEATAMGILFLGLNITSIALTLLMEQLKDPKTGSYLVPLIISVGVCAAGTLLTLLFRPEYKRLEFEKIEKEKQKSKSTQSSYRTFGE